MDVERSAGCGIGSEPGEVFGARAIGPATFYGRSGFAVLDAEPRTETRIDRWRQVEETGD